MDLLEYMRAQNNMTQAEWERTFEDEAREILVLLAGGSGAGKRNGFWDVSHYFIAYVDCQTGALHTGDGRIVYPVNDEEHDAGGILDRFRREAVYRLKARKKIPHEVPEGVTASSLNEFLIVEVLEEDAPCPAREGVLAEYRRPVVVTDEVLGELTLDKDLDMFEGEVLWRGEQICVSLEVDAADEDTWADARRAMTVMLAEQDRWDRDMRASAARESSPNSRASGASPPTRRSPRLRKRASLAGSSCAPSRWNLTARSQPILTMMRCSSVTASLRTDL